MKEQEIVNVQWAFVAKNDASRSLCMIKIYAPILDENGDWRCNMETNLLGRATRKWAYGSDGLDALGSCLKLLAVDAVCFARDMNGSFETEDGLRPSVLNLFTEGGRM
jgi:hypothetical protein